jgi:hypothetical protein
LEQAERYAERFYADLETLKTIYPKLEAWVAHLVEEIGVNRQAVVEHLGRDLLTLRRKDAKEREALGKEFPYSPRITRPR